LISVGYLDQILDLESRNAGKCFDLDSGSRKNHGLDPDPVLRSLLVTLNSKQPFSCVDAIFGINLHNFKFPKDIPMITGVNNIFILI